jgi:hypothetical protein
MTGTTRQPRRGRLRRRQRGRGHAMQLPLCPCTSRAGPLDHARLWQLGQYILLDLQDIFA